MNWRLLAVAAALTLGVPSLGHDFSTAGGTIPGPPTDSHGPPRPCSDEEITCNQSCGADPVYLGPGEFYKERTDVFLPGRMLDLDITFRYRSRSAYNGSFGYGWDMSYNVRVKRLDTGNALVLTGDGRDEEYTWQPFTETYQSPQLVYWTLTLEPDGTHTRVSRDGVRQRFDLNGNLVAIGDRFGNALTLTYTPEPMSISGLMEYVVGSKAGVIAREYLLLSIQDTVGRTVTFDYDDNGRLEVLNCLGRIYTYAYDPSHNGNLLSVTYPGTDLIPSGTTEQYGYDSRHNLRTVTSPEGQIVVTNSYDLTADRLTSQQWGAGTFTFSYVAGTTTVIDPRGVMSTHVLNANGQSTETKVFTDGIPAGEPSFYRTTHEYDGSGFRTRTVWPRGNATEWKYSVKGQITEVRRKPIGATAYVANPGDIVTKYTYEPTFWQLASVTDANGKTRTYTFDFGAGEPGLGLAKKLTLPGVAAGVPEYQYAYNSFGQLESVIDPNGIVTKLAYDPALGYLKVVTEAFGTADATATTYGEDTFGNVTSIANGEGQTRTFTYDAHNQLRHALTSGVPDHLELRYDRNGNVKEARGSGVPGGFLSFAYTPLDWLQSVTNSLSESTQYQYDNAGNVRFVTDPMGYPTETQYDERGLAITQIDANGGIVALGYGANGNTTSLRDPNGNVTHWEYDDFDRATVLRYPSPSTATELYEYDKLGNLKATVDPKGQRIERDYDAAYQSVTAERWIGTSTVFGLTYDAGGRLLAVSDPAYGTMTFGHDHASRLASESTPYGRTVGYQYDLASRMKKLTYPDGSFLTHIYDALDRLTHIKEGPTDDLVATLGYDGLGRRSQLSMADGTTTTYRYDGASRVESIVVAGGASGPRRLEYQYDRAGNPTRRVRDEISTFFRYDRLHQLVYEGGLQRIEPAPLGDPPLPASETPPTFEYDAAGNRVISREKGVPTAYVSNHLNQYVSVGGTAHTYDDNGNLTSDGVSTYGYDYRNRLVTAAGAFGSATYQYDFFGRRVVKAVNGTSIRLVPAWLHVLESTTTDTLQVAEYLYGAELDELIRMSRSDADLFYHSDGLGSVLSLSAADGALVERYAYGANGIISIRDASGMPLPASDVDNPYTFVGREYDAETSSYQLRSRQYLATQGRFLSRDPLLYASGFNVYTYAYNAPTKWRDPLGLDVTIEIKRETYTANGISGTIRAWSDVPGVRSFSGYALENKTLTQGDRLPIAAGTYPAFLRTDYNPDRIQLTNVSGHDGIQIHPGNVPSNANGCFLAGTTQGEDFVGNSVAAQLELLDIIRADGSGRINVRVVGPNVAPPLLPPR